MAVYLGIDTGGTYTDAVLYDSKEGVQRSGKSLTTRYDLTVGIRNVLETVLPDPVPEIQLVSLSTTLATNAIVEGQGNSICLLLIGYDADALKQAGLDEVMKNDPVVFLDGGHLASGKERMPLDLEAAQKAIQKYAGGVSAFAVSGFFGVRNPDHENRVRELVRSLTDLPVTCGHELTSNLHASRRALTAALNARLIHLIQSLVQAVQTMLALKNIRAPLMVVKGDGSLVKAAFALEYPIETILSGPAASVVGAMHLSGEKDACIVDMGGTTTDIALLRNGKPALDRDGATVGGFQTMVEAVRIYTRGLGGDSEIHFDPKDGFTVGPRRSVPLGLLAVEYPQVLPALQRQAAQGGRDSYLGRFALLQRTESVSSAVQQSIIERLQGGPQSVLSLARNEDSQYLLFMELMRLVDRGIVSISSFTPTDAAHVLGLFSSWSVPAAQCGAEIMLRQAQGRGLFSQEDTQGFCRAVLERVVLQSGRALVSAALAQQDGRSLEELHELRDVFIDPALSKESGTGLFDVQLSLNTPLVAIGAPVHCYYPDVAERLHTRLCIPEHSEIANAVGAVAGNVTQTVRVLISLQEDGDCFRVHLPEGIADFADLERAAESAAQAARTAAQEHALRAGAADVHIRVERNDRYAQAAEDDLFIECELTAVAVGRPRLAMDGD